MAQFRTIHSNWNNDPPTIWEDHVRSKARRRAQQQFVPTNDVTCGRTHDSHPASSLDKTAERVSILTLSAGPNELGQIKHKKEQYPTDVVQYSFAVEQRLDAWCIRPEEHGRLDAWCIRPEEHGRLDAWCIRPEEHGRLDAWCIRPEEHRCLDAWCIRPENSFLHSLCTKEPQQYK